ncbi:MAG: hypothetical protein A2Y17_03610 [Clostridiales bacterium GWF2_38_85]|nr:MAG: hypothetical protein A2Y17_03610 [Clostridiales bacterium GWF2_38_85]
MKKPISIFLIALLNLTLVASCVRTETDESSYVSTVSINEEISKTEESEPEETVSIMGYNVKDFGAKANGTDDSEYIQAAINECAIKGGGTVYLPSGTYGIAKTIVKSAKVSIVGEGMWATQLKWIGESDNTMIDTANQALWGTSIENIFFLRGNGADKITGILGGSTLTQYNSAIGTFKNLVFSGLYCGISGNAEPSGVGIFDCNFENIFASDCKYGLQLYGSGNTIVHPRIATCEAGLVLDYLNGESFDGVHVIGGIFASNTTDILIPAKNGLRPCDFVGTWFENATEGIITIKNSDTRVMNMTFRDCMLNSAADNKDFFLFDVSKALGVVTLDSCTVVNNEGIIEPKNKQSVLAITNLQVYDSDKTYVISDIKNGNFSTAGNGSKTVYTITHGAGFVPGYVSVTPASKAAAVQYYVEADAQNIIITFITAPKNGKEIAFFWEIKK